MTLPTCPDCNCIPPNIENDKFKQDVESLLCQTLTELGYSFPVGACDPCTCISPNIANDKFKQDVEILLCALLSALSGTGPSGEWRLLGNAGTVDGTNFLGSTDAVPVTFRTTNLARWKIDTSGNLDADATNGGDIVFGKANSALRLNTVDGADNLSVYITGGGAVNTAGSRGAFAEFQGNEGGSTGRLLLFAGNAGGVAQFGTKGSAAVSFHTNALARWSIDTSGNLLQDTSNGADVVFGVTNSSVRTNTADAADNKVIYLTGGGAVNTSGTRGAIVELSGNESNSGRLNIFAGDAGGAFTAGTKGAGAFTIQTNALARWSIDTSGNLNQQANGADLVLTVTNSVIRTDTSDAADNKVFYITGGGAINTSGTRGAFIEMQGNEAGSAGRALFFSGNSTGICQVGTKGSGSLNLVTNNVIALTIDSNGVVQNNIAANESTGAGSALLGTNSPAVTLTAPFKWIKLKSQDGSTVYLPVWK